MTAYHSGNVGFLTVGGVDIKSISRSFADSTTKEVRETTPFGKTAVEFEQTGLYNYSLEGHDGWYDDSYAATLGALSGTEQVVMFAHEGNTKGKHCVCAGGMLQSGYTRGFAIGEFHTAKMGMTVSGTKDDGLIVLALAQVAGDGNSEAASLDLGVAGIGAAGCNVYLVCTALALTGSTNLIVTLEDSANNIAWADHTVMTALTAVGAEKKVATDLTVNQYLAVKRVFTALAGSPTATIAVAVKVNY